MNGSGQKSEGKKKVNEIKTFPVPFPLEEIKENIIINSNTPSKPSKDEIINKAFKCHSKGLFSEASKYYQYLINKGSYDYRVFYSYGEILKDLGKLKEAEINVRKSINLRPKFYYSNVILASILADLGELEEAKIFALRAIEIDAELADAYGIMSNILYLSHNKKKAIDFQKKYLNIKSKNIKTKSNIKNVIDSFTQKISNQNNIPTFFDTATYNQILGSSKDNTDYSYIYETLMKSKDNRFITYQERNKTTQNRRQIDELPFLISQGTHSLIKWKEYNLYKTTYDLILYWMILYEAQPEIIIELGSGEGGSAIWMADICKSLGFDTHIFSYDINKPDLDYLGITFIEFDINKLDIKKGFPFMNSWKGKRKLLIEDAHVNVLNVLNVIDIFVEKDDYLIIEDSLFKQKQIEKFTRQYPEKYLVDQYYLDFFSINMTCSIDSIFKVF